MATLRGQVKMLTAQLEAEQKSKEMAVANAVLEVQKSVEEKLLDRYRAGLRDGASLTNGKGIDSSPGSLQGSLGGFGPFGSPI